MRGDVHTAAGGERVSFGLTWRTRGFPPSVPNNTSVAKSLMTMTNDVADRPTAPNLREVMIRDITNLSE
ncbi:hypothetical protein NJ76_13945 [Rhodococcus sp. IITR03]|nr:hypothetical protein NJ76_13945 [Rhodococcus sp. IITR03]